MIFNDVQQAEFFYKERKTKQKRQPSAIRRIQENQSNSKLLTFIALEHTFGLLKTISKLTRNAKKNEIA